MDELIKNCIFCTVQVGACIISSPRTTFEFPFLTTIEDRQAGRQARRQLTSAQDLLHTLHSGFCTSERFISTKAFWWNKKEGSEKVKVHIMRIQPKSKVFFQLTRRWWKYLLVVILSQNWILRTENSATFRKFTATTVPIPIVPASNETNIVYFHLLVQLVFEVIKTIRHHISNTRSLGAPPGPDF